MRQRIVPWSIGLLALGLLSGCGLARQERAERQRKQDLQMLDIAENDCPTYYPRDRVEQADCVNRAEDRYLRPYIANSDLLTMVQTQRHFLATQVARGAMSSEEAAARLAQVTTDALDRDAQRQNMAMAAQAQQSAASAQMLGVAAALMRPPLAPTPPFPVHTSCYQMGPYLNCNSN